MKLPFRQLPEIQPGHGLLVGAPHAGGTTFFLSRLAREAFNQNMSVSYLGQMDGSAWLIDMATAQNCKLKFLNYRDRMFDSRTLEATILSALTADMMIIDGLDSVVQQTVDRKGSEAGYLTHIMNVSLSKAAQDNKIVVFGVAVQKGEELPQKPADADSWSWNKMSVTPVIHKMETAHEEWKNLTVVKLLKETKDVV